MNLKIIVSGTYTPYDSNPTIIMGDHLWNGANSVTADFINTGLGTQSNSHHASCSTNGMDHCSITNLAATNASMTATSDNFEQTVTADLDERRKEVKIDKDIQEKVSSYNMPDNQKKILSWAIQSKREGWDSVLVVYNTDTFRNIFRKEGVKLITYEESGMLNGWTCHRRN